MHEVALCHCLLIDLCLTSCPELTKQERDINLILVLPMSISENDLWATCLKKTSLPAPAYPSIAMVIFFHEF